MAVGAGRLQGRGAMISARLSLRKLMDRCVGGGDKTVSSGGGATQPAAEGQQQCWWIGVCEETVVVTESGV